MFSKPPARARWISPALMAWAADLVDGLGVEGAVKPRLEAGLPGGILPQPALKDAAHDAFLDMVLGGGDLLEDPFDGEGAELRAGHAAQRPEEPPRGKTFGGENHWLWHGGDAPGQNVLGLVERTISLVLSRRPRPVADLGPDG